VFCDSAGIPAIGSLTNIDVVFGSLSFVRLDIWRCFFEGYPEVQRQNRIRQAAGWKL
jgi:hypothetical protein